MAVGAALSLVVGGVAAFALLRERNHAPWACPADRLGSILVTSAGRGGADTALAVVAESIPSLAEDTGLPEATLREAAASFERPAGRSATYRLTVPDGVVAEFSVGRLRDDTWNVHRMQQCFREP